jgi:O-methyltransferase
MNIEEIKKRILSVDNINERLSMVASPKVLDNVESCILTCMEDNVDGDFVETGVWKGGCSILAFNLYKQLKLNNKVYLYDSFAGLPPPDASKYPVDAGDIHYTHTELAISLESVKKNFELFSELDDSVIFIEGWFRDTIPINNIDKISILRLDGDMYESTIDPLEYLYPKLSIGGFCIIDDYAHVGARSAVDYYRAKHNIEDEVITIDPTQGVYPSSYWRKTH